MTARQRRKLAARDTFVSRSASYRWLEKRGAMLSTGGVRGWSREARARFAYATAAGIGNSGRRELRWQAAHNAYVIVDPSCESEAGYLAYLRALYPGRGPRT